MPPVDAEVTVDCNRHVRRGAHVNVIDEREQTRQAVPEHRHPGGEEQPAEREVPENGAALDEDDDVPDTTPKEGERDKKRAATPTSGRRWPFSS